MTFSTLRIIVSCCFSLCLHILIVFSLLLSIVSQLTQTTHSKIWPMVSLLCTIFRIIGGKSQALLAFSFYSNGIKLLSYKKSKAPDVMHCLHGIRAISTQWVVLGHSYMMYMRLPARNSIQYLMVCF